MTAPHAQYTDFTVDVLGRYVCNGLDEALRSADPAGRRRDGSSQEDAHPFDVIVLGGGSFGPILAQHLLHADRTRAHRILVLEGGRLAVPEHIQNLPLMVADLPVWSVPWSPAPGQDLRFKGLAYCLGGRSIFFGGWSPELLDSELASWPPAVARDLKARYFASAARLIGTAEANDFIAGPLHEAMREQLREGLNAGGMPERVPWQDLPLPLTLRPDTPPEQVERLKLEAPLAVASRAPKGFFPVNKFSAVPLITRAARIAYGESLGDDVHKRFMIVPDCLVQRLETSTSNGRLRVTKVVTSKGDVAVSDGGVVVIALGTIESARLALLSFPGVPSAARMGLNLMAHLRSNLHVRIPRGRLTHLSPDVRQLLSSALFVRGRHADSRTGTIGHYHLQITASGLGLAGTDSEAELFKKVPDVEFFEVQRTATDTTVVVTIRAIGEMRAGNPSSFVTLDGGTNGFGVRRALASLQTTREDDELWDAMDRAADQVARVLNGGPGYEVIARNRDRLGTTHHEVGTLAMGVDPATSVTDVNGRFHDAMNAYAVGPAVFPTIGSPNPMLTGCALARRLADHLVETLPRHVPVEVDGFSLLFDGRDIGRWRMSTIRNQPGRDHPGGFHVVDGGLEVVPGTDLGLLWCDRPIAGDLTLRLEWRQWRDDANSGVFVGFPHPEGQGYDNSAYVAVHRGFEVQIDNLARDDDAPVHLTGAVYGFAGPSDPGGLPLRPLGQWNELVVEYTGAGTRRRRIRVWINPGRHPDPVTDFTFALGQDASQPERGRSNPTYVGLQTHTGRVAFRSIQVR